MKNQKRSLLLSFAVLLLLVAGVNAQQGYKKPPKEVLDILNAPVTPGASISPTRDNMLLTKGLRYPPLADLAQPMLRLAGRRINPASNSPHRLQNSDRSQYSVGLTLKRIADGSEVQIQVPPGAKITSIEWSDDGKHFAFLNTTPNRVDLWIGDAATGKIRSVENVQIKFSARQSSHVDAGQPHVAGPTRSFVARPGARVATRSARTKHAGEFRPSWTSQNLRRFVEEPA